MIFLNRLQARIADIDYAVIPLIDQDYNCTWDKNPEIGQRWFPLAFAFNYQQAFAGAHDLITRQGRMKYLNPVYQALVDIGRRDLAWQWLQENKDFYHPIAYQKEYSIIFLSLSSEEEQKLKKVEESIAKGYIIY